MSNYVLNFIVGWGLATWILMRIFWLPDPPPDAIFKYFVWGIIGAVGGVLGGVAVAGSVQSNPMPGLFTVVGALAGSASLVGLARAFGLNPRRTS